MFEWTQDKIDEALARADMAAEVTLPIEQFKAILRQASPSEWQPVELHITNDEVDVWCGYRAIRCWLDRQWNRWYIWDVEMNRMKIFGGEPSHFMPLPPPPNNHNREGA